MQQISIVGDSISTYEGYNPEGYAVFYNEEMRKVNGLTSVKDTWWTKVNQAMYAELCINNSYSGSTVTGKEFPAATSEKRLLNLHRGEIYPDVILFYIGFNDFGRGVPVLGKFPYLDKSLHFFKHAYEKMISYVSQKYPQAKLVCGTLMCSKIEGDSQWIFPESYAGVKLEEYNHAIRKVCKKKKCYLADLSAQNVRYETLDGTHPTKKGHQTIANTWIKCLREMYDGIIQL